MSSTTEEKTVMNVAGATIVAKTAAGASYVKKVTHPPTTMPQEYQGVPDCSQPNVVLMEVKSEINIAPIYTSVAGATATVVNPSSILFLTGSGAYVGSWIFFLSGNQWLQPMSQTAVPITNQFNPPATTMAGYNFDNFYNDCSSFRTTYKSTTFYLNATDFNNQGTVTSAKFKPETLLDTSVNLFARLPASEHESLFRCLNAIDPIKFAKGKSGKGYDDCYELYDAQGNAHSSSQSIAYVQLLTVNSNALFSVNGSSPVSVGAFPIDASSVLVSSPKGCTRPAKDGAFVVQQPIGDVQPWVGNITGQVVSSTIPQEMPICVLRSYTGNTVNFSPLYSQRYNSTTSSLLGLATDTVWNNLDWSYTLFEGLTIPSTTGVTLSSVPYITVKTFTGLELQVRSSSSLLSFQRLLPLPDRSAIEMAVGIFHARPDSLPASANDLASIASAAVKFLPTAVGWLKDLFSSKPAEKEAAVEKAAKFAGVKNKTYTKSKDPKKPVVKAIAREDNGIKALTKQVANLSSIVMKTQEPATTLPNYSNMGNIGRPRGAGAMVARARLPRRTAAKPKAQGNAKTRFFGS